MDIIGAFFWCDLVDNFADVLPCFFPVAFLRH
ncbi:hypothetical protein MNBD_GAMMA15-210, partial [hydrothermal vent metagenome]